MDSEIAVLRVSITHNRVARTVFSIKKPQLMNRVVTKNRSLTFPDVVNTEMTAQSFKQPDVTQTKPITMGCVVCLIVLVGLISGCTSLTGQRAMTPAEARERELLAQIQEITVRAESLDKLNEKYQKDLGQASTILEKSDQELITSRQQIADLSNKVASLEAELSQSRQSVQTYQASMHRQSTVTLTPNSSFHNQQLAISSPGVTTVADGDYIRVCIPDAYLFQSGGTWELSMEGRRTLTEVGNQLRLNFPNQEIGVEGHTNQLAINSQRKLNAHEVAAKKAFSVANYLTSENILEEGRLRVGGAGANRPMDYSGTTEGELKNSRIELVVYPTTWK